MLVLAHQRLGGDGDLHPPADRTEPAGPVGPVGGVDDGRPAEDEVAEDVGAQLVHRPHIGRLARGRSIRGRSRANPCVLDRLAHLGEPVEHSHRDHRRDRRDHIRHPVGTVQHPHAPARRGLAVPLCERPLMQFLRQSPQRLPHPGGDVALAYRDRRSLELRPHLRGHTGPGFHDDVDVIAGDPARLPRREHGRVVIHDRQRVIDIRLQSAVAAPGHARSLCRHRPQLHVRCHPTHPITARLTQSRPTQLGQHPNSANLRDVRGPQRVGKIGEDSGVGRVG
ncbi:hypothetical protein [Microbacterium arborescens]|uniref:hypothetical protein n=1 Tax=Microbacterium arborescens TaxID=33883 RepID=UPI003C77FF46